VAYPVTVNGVDQIFLRYLSSPNPVQFVRTGGDVKPVMLKDNVKEYLPDWSRAGDWITYRDKMVWNLISPDGKISKTLGKIETPYLAFSRNGKLAYGIHGAETLTDRDRAALFSIDLATLKQKLIRQLGKELQPSIGLNGTRFSVAPNGKSIVYATSRDRTDLWMLQGYRQPGWFGRLSSAFK
jgi:Tol biopolymer transport system component